MEVTNWFGGGEGAGLHAERTVECGVEWKTQMGLEGQARKDICVYSEGVLILFQVQRKTTERF